MAYSDQHLVQIVCYSDQHLVRIQTSGGWLYSDQHCTFVGTFVGIHQRDGGTFDLFVDMEAEYGLHMGTSRIICGACTLTYWRTQTEYGHSKNYMWRTHSTLLVHVD